MSRGKKKNKNIDNVLLISKFPGLCKHCSNKVNKGDKVWWSSKTKGVVHFNCFEEYKGYGV